MKKISARMGPGMTVTISDGRHEWLGDEPTDVGGTDGGPNPYELLLSSLATCTCVTLRLYCNHKGIALKSVEATYTHDRVEASELPETDRTGEVDRIRGTIRINGEFDDAQRKRLAQIASRCPVHRTLAAGVHLVDEVEFG